MECDSVAQQCGVQVARSVDALRTCAMNKNVFHFVESAREHVCRWVEQPLCTDVPAGSQVAIRTGKSDAV